MTPPLGECMPGLDIGQPIEKGFRYRLAGEVPDDRPYLDVRMKSKAVVDTPQLAVVVLDQVVGLAVGAIGHQVETTDDLQLGGVFRRQGVIVLFGVVADELLDRPDTVGTVADHGEGDNVPAQGVA